MIGRLAPCRRLASHRGDAADAEPEVHAVGARDVDVEDLLDHAHPKLDRGVLEDEVEVDEDVEDHHDAEDRPRDRWPNALS